MASKRKTNENKLAIAYYRYSSHSQNEASIDQQKQAAHAYADQRGLTIVREYQDPEYSGTNDDRPDFNRMLAEVELLQPSVLILWDADRMARDSEFAGFARYTLRKAGCEPVYTNKHTPDPDSPDAPLMNAMYDGFAAYYSRQLSVNIQRGMRYNAERGLFNGHSLFGYAVDDTKHYIPDPDTAPVVQRVFREYADGKAMADIARDLNDRGLRTTKGNEWTSNNLRSMLKNRRYIGEYHEGEFIIKNGMPRLIDDDTFERAQARFAMNKRLGSRRANNCEDAPEFWLTGKLYCGECGRPMNGTSGSSHTGTRHYYYQCSGRRGKKRNGCKKKNVRKEVIEELVLELLKSFLHDDELLASFAADAAAYYEEKHANDSACLKSLEKQQREVEKSLNNIVRAIEQGAYSETLQARLTELEARKRALEDSIAAEEALQQLAEDEHDFHAYFYQYANANLDDTEVRSEVLEYFVDRIYLYDDRLLITGWIQDYASGDWYQEGWRLGDYDVGFVRFAHGSTMNRKPFSNGRLSCSGTS